MKLFVAIILLGLFCSGCALSKVEGPKKDGTASAPTEQAGQASALPKATPFGQVTQEEFGKDWPSMVDCGGLRCDGEKGKGAVVFLANGEIYAVNGTAMATKKFKKIDLIWADHPVFPKTKKNISPLLERGLLLCRK